jgi:flavin reductase (DIM6/NTAB) family NADH-FMN oxidoreductase RutF
VSESEFEILEWRSFKENSAEMLAEEWMLITPGAPGRWNTMTASWGGFGHVWNMDVAFVFIRPSRYTYVFMEKEEGFTLSFLGEGGRKALDLCGARSGRDTNKAKAAGLRPRSFIAAPRSPDSPGIARVGFEEARLVLSCRRIYAQDLSPKGFIDPSIARNYPSGDVHRLYAGAIEGAWRRV